MRALDNAPLLARHRFSVDDYHQMGEVGVFAPNTHVELIDGELIDMAPIGPRHASVVSRLNRALNQAVGTTAIVSVQNPLRLSDYSEPQPDLMLLLPREDFYADAHPRAADVLLLIEVADTSARYDRRIKLPLYARHGVAEVWIVDLDARLLRYCRSPAGEAYTDITSTDAPSATPVGLMPGIQVDLSGVLG